MPVTIRDLHKHLEQLIGQGKGDRVIKLNYDGFIYDFDSADKVMEEVTCDGRGVCQGTFNKGDFIIET